MSPFPKLHGTVIYWLMSEILPAFICAKMMPLFHCVSCCLKKPGEGARYKDLMRRSSTKKVAWLLIGTVNNGNRKQAISMHFHTNNLWWFFGWIHNLSKRILTYGSQSLQWGGKHVSHITSVKNFCAHPRRSTSPERSHWNTHFSTL